MLMQLKPQFPSTVLALCAAGIPFSKSSGLSYTRRIFQKNVLNAWANQDPPVKRATTFELEEYTSVQKLPHSAENLPFQAYMTCDVAFAGRSIEVYHLKKSSVKLLADFMNATRRYEISYMRVKQPGQPPEVMSAFITGPREVAIMDAYMECIKDLPGDRNLFQKLNGKTMKPMQNIGIHTLKECGKRFALAIGKFKL